jgi:hypothetical protein
MAYVPLTTLETKLVALLTQTATTLPVDAATASLICASIVATDHTYLTIRSGGISEEIKVGACVAGVVTILARGVNGTIPRTFAADACVDGKLTTLALAESTTPPVGCSPTTDLAWTLPPGNVRDKYNACITIPSTAFAVGDYMIPDGFDVALIGSRLCLFSESPERTTGFPVTIELVDKTGCVAIQVVGQLVIVDDCYRPDLCNAQCVYEWSITPSLITVGGSVTVGFTPPTSCPADTTLSLDVFESDGTTPYMVPGIVPLTQLQINVKPGGFVYTADAADAGSVLVFKPSAQQQNCLSACSPSVPSQKRIVLPQSGCAVTWSMAAHQFTAGVSSPQTYTLMGATGDCSVLFKLYEGNTLLDFGDFTLTASAPVYSPAGGLLFPAAVIGRDFNYRPFSRSGSCAGCTVSPARIDFDVFAGTTNTCGGILTATAGTCTTTSVPPAPPPNVGASCIALGACDGGGSVPVLTATSNAGASYTVEQSIDNGATWTLLNGPTSVPASGQLWSFGGCGSVSLAVTGIASWSFNASTKYRFKLGSVVLTRCP